jgi:two-component sensor histidine kinase
MPVRVWLSGFNRYLIAILLVVLAFCTREALIPVLGETRVAFSTFYLAVVLAAYFSGVGPAICASIRAAGIAYWAFVSPAYAPKLDVDSLTSMGFFALTSAVDIYFITGMRRALQEYRAERTRAELLAQGNADLFREFNERATTHLQLVAALLHLRSREGLDSAYSNALADASRRTLMISRVHRSLNHGATPLTDFSGFTRQLLAAFVEASEHHDIRVTVSGDEMLLPGEQATSMATILYECFRFALQHQPMDATGIIDVDLTRDADGYCLRLSSPTAKLPMGTGLLSEELTRQVIEAMTDHLQGRFANLSVPQGISFELIMPTNPVGPTAPKFDLAAEPVSTMLH